MTSAAAYMPAHHPRHQADAGIPAIPAIPLSLLDAMAALGWTIDMAVVAYRAALALATGSRPATAESRESQESPRQSQKSRAAAVNSLDAKERKRLRDRINVANKRAAQRAAKESHVAHESRDVAHVASDSSDNGATLSLKKENPSLKEREGVAPVANVASDKATSRSPMPPDWQPWPKNAAFAVAELGDRGAANATANYREHYEAAGTLMTEPERQARFRKWVRVDRDRVTSRQGHLALPIAGGRSAKIADAARDSPDRLWKLQQSYQVQREEEVRRDAPRDIPDDQREHVGKLLHDLAQAMKVRAAEHNEMRTLARRESG